MLCAMKTMRRHEDMRPARIEVHVELIDQLFNSIDPSPFNARDLEPAAEAYIVDSSKDFHRDAPLELVIHLDQPPAAQERLSLVSPAIQTHFAARAAASRLRLKELFGRGRTSLMIGLAFLSFSIALGELSKSWLPEGSPAHIMREGLLIGGWVAMWRPMEIFLYDWWPIRALIGLQDRLAVMPVRITFHRPREAKVEAVPAEDNSTNHVGITG